MNKCPCKGCQDRTLTCHGVCRRYQDWKAEREKALEWLRKEKNITSEFWRKATNKRLLRQARGWDKKHKGYLD